MRPCAVDVAVPQASSSYGLFLSIMLQIILVAVPSFGDVGISELGSTVCAHGHRWVLSWRRPDVWRGET
jgi:hypothetical protein